MLIYIKTYTAYHSDFVELQCKCEKCGNDFSYKFINTSVGVAISPYGMTDSSAKKSAINSAQSSFKHMSSSKIPHFPCPHCGWYQSWMNSKYRKRRLLKSLIALSLAIPPLYLGSLLDYAIRDNTPGLTSGIHGIITSPFNLLSTIPATLALIAIIIIKFKSDLNKKAPPVTNAWDASNSTESELVYYISFDQGATHKGPFSLKEIKSMLNCNRITHDVMISLANDVQWKKLYELLPDLAPS